MLEVYDTIRGPKDHISIRILQTMMFCIPLILGLGARMSDPWSFGPLTMEAPTIVLIFAFASWDASISSEPDLN